MATPLNESQIQAALSELPGWAYTDGKLTKTYKFHHFREAMSFIVRIAFEAEQRNHHPDLFNSYHTVKLSLCTHDAGHKVTEKDVDLAKAIRHLSWVD